MARYDFVCRECRKKFEISVSIGDYNPKKIACPKCGSKKVERVWSPVFVETSKKS
jgi:putative FmdB family regulatory protein